MNRISDLEQQLKNAKEEIKQLEEERNFYRDLTNSIFKYANNESIIQAKNDIAQKLLNFEV